MGRNDPCYCGSGKRFKHCHGSVEAPAENVLRARAIVAHRSGDLREAERLYRDALKADPGDAEAQEMLGVARFERMDYDEAFELLVAAAERSGWADAGVRHNLGLVIAKLNGAAANAQQETLVAAHLALERARSARAALAAPVSVIVAIHHAGPGDVVRSLDSVSAQTFPDFDVVIADASGDAAIAADIDRWRRSFRGKSAYTMVAARRFAACANAGALAAQRPYLAFLDAGDAFDPRRLESMAAAITGEEPLWGFSRIDGGAGPGRAATAGTPADAAVRAARDYLRDEPATFTLLHRDIAASDANLFIERGLFARLGGYRADVPFPGWDLRIRAGEIVEPVAVDAVLYLRQVSSSNSPPESRPGEASRAAFAAARVVDALTSVRDVDNALCPQHPANHDVLLRGELRAGHGDTLPPSILQRAAATLRPVVAARRKTSALATALPRETANSTPAVARTALVVLGMYRSGTSAVARILNLCGAALPRNLVPARLAVNPTGFWEGEAINDFNARLLHRLGGDWDRVNGLHMDGIASDTFAADVKDLLAAEYGASSLILIKDPRICVLAELWHRALAASGYRPVYIVPVRNPLEVARSLAARGDMTVEAGLALWLDYMQRVETFAAGHCGDVVHVRYTDMLDDWRGVVPRIAARLGLALDVDRAGDDVDRFIANGRRNQRAIDAELDALTVAHADTIRLLHRRALARCDVDRSVRGEAR